MFVISIALLGWRFVWSCLSLDIIYDGGFVQCMHQGTWYVNQHIIVL